MKYKLIIPIVTIIVAAVALMAYVQFFAPKKLDRNKEIADNRIDRNAQEETAETESGSNNEEEKMIGTLEDIFQLGDNLFCTYSDGNESEPPYTSGNLYIADEGMRMRGTFTMIDEDSNKTTMNMIRNETGNYMWEEGRNEGYLTKLDTENDSFLQDLMPATEGADENNNLTGEATEQTDPSASMSFDCNTWDVDNELFDLPSGIEFIDLSQQMMELENSLKDSGCSACDQLPEGDAKEQCLTLMKC
ncbi:hypothetical protein H6802_03240 [Candidatus Nomurabacteria bacterium]|uniref:Uncharacterized protein n=1 Tax=candidate division WWE3 bacterium TaxID=2053526 RepID=A0A955E1T5_UNCKA|nr:hypothetical protein [candidate division WWE3 bacterium]MCB9823945.1 hypothetical protein [Candidatus Nomurabacteria bacterium]MCB9827074.1 hypothetical protein [Candidatus Nomurabacteria bacterium]MCB9827884.1 hypothetical protein [Candidatus Nomurabacteria bacterium]